MFLQVQERKKVYAFVYIVLSRHFYDQLTYFGVSGSLHVKDCSNVEISNMNPYFVFYLPFDSSYHGSEDSTNTRFYRIKSQHINILINAKKNLDTCPRHLFNII